MLYTLYLHNVICQFYLNKTKEKILNKSRGVLGHLCYFLFLNHDPFSCHD